MEGKARTNELRRRNYAIKQALAKDLPAPIFDPLPKRKFKTSEENRNKNKKCKERLKNKNLGLPYEPYIKRPKAISEEEKRERIRSRARNTAALVRKSQPEKVKERGRKCKVKFKEKYNERQREKRKTEEYRAKRRNYDKLRMTNPKNKIERSLRSGLRRVLVRRNCYKQAKFYQLLGCDKDYLFRHIENQFCEGMTWDNYGSNGWHIDHIVPCASFDLTDIEDQKRCFHYTNLQPLWAEDNMRKGSKLIF